METIKIAPTGKNAPNEACILVMTFGFVLWLNLFSSSFQLYITSSWIIEYEPLSDK